MVTPGRRSERGLANFGAGTTKKRLGTTRAPRYGLAGYTQSRTCSLTLTAQTDRGPMAHNPQKTARCQWMSY